MIQGTKVLSIIELLTACLFHDLASPMSGIINSVEFFKSDNIEEALSILQEGSSSLLYKFKVMQQAYSFSESNSNFEETKCNIINYLSCKEIKVKWSIVNLNTEDKDLISKINKVISNIAILIKYKMTIDSTVLLKVKEENNKIILTVKMTKKGVNISSLLKTALKDIDNNQLDTKNINTYFLHLLLKSYDAHIEYDNDDVVSIAFLNMR